MSKSVGVASSQLARTRLTVRLRLYQFLKDVRDHADKMGWTEGILGITINSGADNEHAESFMENYGTITLEQVVASELLYIDDEGRLAQHTYNKQVSSVALLKDGYWSLLLFDRQSLRSAVAVKRRRGPHHHWVRLDCAVASNIPTPLNHENEIIWYALIADCWQHYNLGMLWYDYAAVQLSVVVANTPDVR